MLLSLERLYFSDHSTIGNLSIDGNFECFTLEDKVRELEGIPVEEWKVPKETAISRGRFQVILTFSTRFQRILPVLLNVPGFSGIRLHGGNTDKDTEGCILVGREKRMDGTIHDSTILSSLIEQIRVATQENFEECWITII